MMVNAGGERATFTSSSPGARPSMRNVLDARGARFTMTANVPSASRGTTSLDHCPSSRRMVIFATRAASSRSTSLPTTYGLTSEDIAGYCNQIFAPAG
jgi:hypothetical protein